MAQQDRTRTPIITRDTKITITEESPSAFHTLKSSLLILGPTLSLSIFFFIHIRALTPLFAAGPTTQHAAYVLGACILLASVHPWRIPIWLSTGLLGGWLAVVPRLGLAIAREMSKGGKEPLWGPLKTHLAVLAPVALLAVAVIAEVDLRTDAKPPITQRLAYTVVLYRLATQLSDDVWPLLKFLNGVSDSDICLSLATLSFCTCIFFLPIDLSPSAQPRNEKEVKARAKKLLAGGPSPFEPKNLAAKSALLAVFLAAWYAVQPKLHNAVLPHPLPEPYIHGEFPYIIHSAVQSVTGLIVVADIPPPQHPGGADDQESPLHSVRFMRASHSLLGGTWMVDRVQTLDMETAPLYDEQGDALGDSIYSAFVLQEAVRLVEGRELKHGLIIGLGTGIAATAFQRHGINTTIVEIDPAVYQAARTYFGLPDPGPDRVFLEDAREFVEKRLFATRRGEEREPFDFAVHDCFSGGGVPEHIFTSEFWALLKQTLTEDGLVAVNIAGHIKSDAYRMVLYTLQKSFKQCVAFHDLLGDITPEQYDREFLNVVTICSDSPVKLTFRRPTRADYLGSPLRRHVFDSLPERQLDLARVRDGQAADDETYVVTDRHNTLGALQESQGAHHWSLMREVLPDRYWEIH